MKPLGKVKIKWSSEFAYAIGLLTTDGNLSPDGRHIVFTSKDLELIHKFQKSLKINFHIGRKSSSFQGDKKYYVVQIGDVLFYKFLLSIGLMPNKTKIIGVIQIPNKYFFDFLRGHFDGDGSFYSYWDPRWKSSFMFYTEFISASKDHIDWLQNKIYEFLAISGHITKSVNSSVYQLKYAKAESLKLFPKLYYNKKVVCLRRKRLKMEKAFRINDKHINNARVS
ncbi:MAG: LAGLIDADG family homing endonuclease [Patescibacteria group bacterium]